MVSLRSPELSDKFFNTSVTWEVPFYFISLSLHCDIHNVWWDIQLTIMHNQWEPWACLSFSWMFPLGMMRDRDMQSMLLRSSLFYNLILVAVTVENPVSQKDDRILEMEASFSVLLQQSQDISPWFLIYNVWRVWSCVSHTFKATIIWSPADDPFLAQKIWFTWLVHK